MHVYQIIVYNNSPCSELKERVQDKAEIITKFTLKKSNIAQI